MTYGLHLGCCIAHMRTLPTASVHLIICDSPYGNTDLVFDKQPVNWAGWWAEAKRVLVPTGVIVCFAAEAFTLDLIASNRDWYRYRRVWHKTRPSRYCDVAWRPLCVHEDLVLFMPAPKTATYNPQRTARTGNKKGTTRKGKPAHYNMERDGTYVDDGLRQPTTVLAFESVGSTMPHFNPTAKPVPLIQDLVLTYSNPGDTILEPFAGDAPTGRVCQNTGRHYIGCEVNPAQYEWSQKMLQQHAPLFAAP